MMVAVAAVRLVLGAVIERRSRFVCLARHHLEQMGTLAYPADDPEG